MASRSDEMEKRMSLPNPVLFSLDTSERAERSSTRREVRVEERRFKIAVLGGTGAQGSALALRLSAAGHALTIGSRDAERAGIAAAQLGTRIGKTIAGGDHRTAAAAAEIVILTVPYAVQRATVEHVLDALQGKIMV